jgi:hypothetical protein
MRIQMRSLVLAIVRAGSVGGVGLALCLRAAKNQVADPPHGETTVPMPRSNKAPADSSVRTRHFARYFRNIFDMAYAGADN